jgi:tetratricopeptide (TPR) repeat protein
MKISDSRVQISNIKYRISNLLILVIAFVIITLFCGGPVIAAPAIQGKIPSCRIYRVMARAYMAYGQFDKATPLAEKALALAQQRSVSNEELSACLLDLAYIYTNLDRFVDAEQFCKLGIQVQKGFYYDRHPYVAYSLRTLAAIYQGQGKISEAKETMRQAIEIMLESHPADDAVMAPFQVDFAKLLVAEGELIEAEQYYTAALNLINQSYGSDHLYTATVISSVAELYVLQQRYSEAEPLINKSQAIQEKFYGSENQLVVGVWLTKARICQAKGERSEAERLIQKARNVIQKTGNSAQTAKLERKIVDIRQVKPDTYQPVAKIFDAST